MLSINVVQEKRFKVIPLLFSLYFIADVISGDPISVFVRILFVFIFVYYLLSTTEIRGTKAFIIVLIYTIILLIQSIPNVVNPVIFFGDILVFLFPLLLIFSQRRPFLFDQFSNKDLLVTALIIFFFTVLYKYFLVGYVRRPYPPATMMIILVTARLFQSKKIEGIIVFTFIVTAFSIALAGQRTALFILLLAVVIFSLINFSRKRLIYLSFVMIASIIIGPFVFSVIMESFGTRLTKLTSGDVSTIARLLEVKDVFYYIGTQWDLKDFLFGKGFGATFPTLFAITNERGYYDGELHNIHNGPVLLIFRHGFVGLLMIGAMLMSSIIGLIKIFFSSEKTTATYQFLWVCTLFILLEFNFRNILIQPLNTVALACYFQMNFLNRSNPV